MIDKQNTSLWPPYTCVACFFFNGLKEFGIDVSPNEIAKRLETKVPKKILNPFNLEESDDERVWGVSVETAKTRIENILAEKAPHLQFKHIPLSTIPYQMYEEVASELFEKKAIVGIGYNFSDFTEADGINRHVSILRKREGIFILEDFYISTTSTILNIKWNALIASAAKIHDGFWVLGEAGKVSSSII